jgi:hypothetical protein
LASGGFGYHPRVGSDAERRPSRRAYLPAAASALLAVALYAHTLGGTWIYDDRFHAHDDPRLANVGRWGDYWREGYFPGGADHLWRPLVSTSYAVQWRLAPGRAWPFHLVNVLLHAGASTLVAELARRLTGRVAVAAAAGLLFAAHPVHVEVVAYLVGRAESACAAGVLGALVLALRPMTYRRAAAIVACVAAAILSKEQGLLAPVLLLALWPLRRQVVRVDAERERTPVRALALVLLFALPAYIAYREQILPWGWDVAAVDYATQPMSRSAGWDRALIPVALLGRAAALLAAPVRLSPEYGLAVITSRQEWPDPYLHIGLVVLLVIVVLTMIAMRRRSRVAMFLLLGAGLSYGMVANVFLIGVVFAERLLYLPSAFVAIGVAIALARALPPRALAAGLAVVVAVMAARSWTYAAQWNDRATFYDRALAASPRSVRLRVLVVGELIAAGDWARAKAVNDAAIAIGPEYWKVWSNAARIAAAQGRLDEAAAALERAWALKGDVAELLRVREEIEARRRAFKPSSS